MFVILYKYFVLHKGKEYLTQLIEQDRDRF